MDGECELPFHPGYIHTLYSMNIVIIKLANCDPMSDPHLTQNICALYILWSTLSQFISSLWAKFYWTVLIPGVSKLHAAPQRPLSTQQQHGPHRLLFVSFLAGQNHTEHGLKATA